MAKSGRFGTRRQINQKETSWLLRLSKLKISIVDWLSPIHLVSWSKSSNSCPAVKTSWSKTRVEEVTTWEQVSVSNHKAARRLKRTKIRASGFKRITFLTARTATAVFRLACSSFESSCFSLETISRIKEKPNGRPEGRTEQTWIGSTDTGVLEGVLVSRTIDAVGEHFNVFAYRLDGRGYHDLALLVCSFWLGGSLTCCLMIVLSCYFNSLHVPMHYPMGLVRMNNWVVTHLQEPWALSPACRRQFDCELWSTATTTSNRQQTNRQPTTDQQQTTDSSLKLGFQKADHV